MIEIAPIQIDDEKLKESITTAADLNNNDEAFAELAAISRFKKQIADALDVVDKIEREAKAAIDSRAKTLYGINWQAIAGQGYKITRSKTGSVYNINPELKPSKKFLIIKESVNSKLVDAEVELHGKLPKGIEINPDRGTMIKVTIK